MHLTVHSNHSTDLGKADVNHTECSRTSDTCTAVNHRRSHSRLQYSGTAYGHEVLQKDIGGLGYPEIRPAEIVKVEYSPCLLSLKRREIADHSLTHSLPHTHTHTHTHSHTHTLIDTPTHSLTHSPTHTPIHSLIRSHSHSLTHLLTHSHTHSFTH